MLHAPRPLLPCALALATALPACRPAEVAPPGPAVIRVGTSSLTPLHAVLGEILEQTDILAQHGLEGRFLDFVRGKDQGEACARGEVDATFSCEVAAMVHLQQQPGSALTGSPGSLGEMALLVRQDSAALTVADLRGGTVSCLGGASSDLALDGWLREAGIEGTVRVEQAGGHGEEAVARLRRGDLEAIVLWDPWLTQAVTEHGFRALARTPFWSVVFTFPEHQEAEVWARYHAALVDALAWGRDHPDQAVAWAAARGGFREDLARQVLLSNDYLAGRAEPSLVPAPAVQERLEACAAWAHRAHMVRPGFSLSDRQRPVP